MTARLAWLALATLSLAACSKQSAQVNAAGSSTVYPFTRAVADQYVAAESGRKPPRITSTGTGAGIKEFCNGAGSEYLDLVDASRRMTRAEYDRCQANKVGPVVEVPIGLDGIALAEAAGGPQLKLTRRDLYLALAANPGGKPNTAKTWRDVNPALPAVAIQLLGPPATSGTRQSFLDLILQPGCLEAMPEARAMQAGADPAAFERLCRELRTDGAYRELGEDHAAIAGALSGNAGALGLIGYSYLEGSGGRLRGVPIDGVEPSAAQIAAGKYPAVRTLYVYAKAKHMKAKPEVTDFLSLYVSMAAPDGALAKRGLVPLSENVRRRARQAVDIADPVDTSALT
jgi:phosphate transport system substrate-binding protein